jgi:hypothetical protein
LQESELLVTIAQVAIGLAGFSGVAGVLGERRGSAQPAVQGALLRGMIEASLLAAGSSLLPIVLLHTSFSPEVLWRLAAGITLAAFSAQVAFAFHRAARIIRSDAPMPPAWRGYMFAGVTFIAFSLAASALGFSPSSFYIAALFLQLVFSGSLFIRFFAFLTS